MALDPVAKIWMVKEKIMPLPVTWVPTTTPAHLMWSLAISLAKLWNVGRSKIPPVIEALIPLITAGFHLIVTSNPLSGAPPETFNLITKLLLATRLVSRTDRDWYTVLHTPNPVTDVA